MELGQKLFGPVLCVYVFTIITRALEHKTLGAFHGTSKGT